MDCSTPDIIKQSDYRGVLNYEAIISAQINRIADSRSKDTKQYEDNVDTLCVMLPDKLRKKAREYKKKHGVRIDLTDNGKQQYDLFWIYINELLELEGGLIFKTSTYEIGKE